jgi:hypothetical protein
LAKVRATSAPMPPAAPVTAATLPLKSIMLSPSRWLAGVPVPTSMPLRHVAFPGSDVGSGIEANDVFPTAQSSSHLERDFTE